MSDKQSIDQDQRELPVKPLCHQTLIAGSFTLNPFPNSLLMLSLTKEAILINGEISTIFPHPNIIPITPELTHRITIQKAADSQNLFWFLQLRENEMKIVLQSSDFAHIGSWRRLMRSHVNKFGFWDDYKPVRRISRGAGSAVYEVTRVEDCKRFAVKAFPKSQFEQNPNFFQGMKKEIKMLRQIAELRHSQLLGIEEVYSSESSYYLIMELCGKDLLRGGKHVKGSRTNKVREAMRQLLSGLAVLHEKGVVHRDIKPNNIMFRSGQNFELVITDFGLATRIHENHPFVKCGTPGFVAPEVFLLQQNQSLSNSASDIFSLGVVFHILLTGQHLFRADSPKELFIKNSKMDFDLTQRMYEQIDANSMNLLQKMLQKDPNNRITAEQALRHEYFIDLEIKLRSPAMTFQSLSQLTTNNQQQFSQIELGITGRKRHKGEYRKASHI